LRLTVEASAASRAASAVVESSILYLERRDLLVTIPEVLSRYLRQVWNVSIDDNAVAAELNVAKENGCRYAKHTDRLYPVAPAASPRQIIHGLACAEAFFTALISAPIVNADAIGDALTLIPSEDTR